MIHKELQLAPKERKVINPGQQGAQEPTDAEVIVGSKNRIGYNGIEMPVRYSRRILQISKKQWDKTEVQRRKKENKQKHQR